MVAAEAIRDGLGCSPLLFGATKFYEGVTAATQVEQWKGGQQKGRGARETDEDEHWQGESGGLVCGGWEYEGFW